MIAVTFFTAVVAPEGHDHSGVAGGSVFATPGWTAGVARLDIDALAGRPAPPSRRGPASDRAKGRPGK